MNLCASFHSDLTHRLLLNEIRYPISYLDTALQELEKRPTVTVILEIVSLASCGLKVDKLMSILQENENIIVDCYQWQDFLTLQGKCSTKQLMYHYPINNYTQLWYVLHFKPYAVTLSEPLTFDLPQARQTVDDLTEQATKIRVVPALGRSSEWILINDDNGFKHFWIMPNTIPVYEPYIDILDLYDADVSREQALIAAYHSQNYTLPVGVLVKNCSSTLPANMVDNELAERRLRCQQRCMRGTINCCHYCDMFQRTAEIARSSR